MSEITSRHRQFCSEAIAFQGLTQSTIAGFKSTMSLFTKDTQIETLAEFTKSNIKEWILYGRFERKWSPKTVRIHLCYLGLFANWCIENGLLAENPTIGIPRPKLEKKLPRCLSEKQEETLMEWVENYRYYYKLERIRAMAIFSTFLGTGIRKSELQNLRMSDVDLDRGALVVRRGKGRKDRIVSFHHTVETVLREYLKQRDRMKRDSPFFFVSLKQDLPLGDNAIKRLFDKIRKKSGVHATPHILRHTFAVRLIQRGFAVQDVQELLGHADLSSTLIYMRATPERLHERVRLNGVSVGASTPAPLPTRKSPMESFRQWATTYPNGQDRDNPAFIASDETWV